MTIQHAFTQATTRNNILAGRVVISAHLSSRIIKHSQLITWGRASTHLFAWRSQQKHDFKKRRNELKNKPEPVLSSFRLFRTGAGVILQTSAAN